MTAMTGAERQAASKARKDEAFAEMAKTVSVLAAENADLRSQLAQMVERVHAAEIKAMAAELRIAKTKK